MLRKCRGGPSCKRLPPIRDLHGCDSARVESVPATETFQGQIAWDGTVEVFDLIDHPTVTRCYAWSHAVDGSEKRRYVAALHGRAGGLSGVGCEGGHSSRAKGRRSVGDPAS